MKCSKCSNDFLENEIHESHDVPCYLFEGIIRNERKNQADKFGRHWLCFECHEIYEHELREHFKQLALAFSVAYFEKKEGKDGSIQKI